MKRIINMMMIAFGILILIPNINVQAQEDDQPVITEKIVDDGFLEEIEEDEVTLYGTLVNVNWSINAKTQKKTKGFTKLEGDEISVNLKVSPNKKIRVGIIQDGKLKKYYETSSMISKKFSITKKATYNVFVQNMSNTTVKVTGNYK